MIGTPYTCKLWSRADQLKGCCESRLESGLVKKKNLSMLLPSPFNGHSSLPNNNRHVLSRISKRVRSSVRLSKSQ